MSTPITHSEDVVLDARKVGKKFCKDLRRSMTYGIGELMQNMAGISPRLDQLRKHEFWAVDDISFELHRGEVLGLIGPNGCGKSTLLRLLAGILPLERGEVRSRGRIGALIALGAGFHPYMTARENTFLNGTILGMSRAEVQREFDSIIDFAELGDFVDAPVATFSSGMRVRLGFAIAVHCRPDILLVDEVLAVGDVGFRAKCYHHMARMMDQVGVILVTHAMAHVVRYSDRVMLLDHGKLLYCGDPAEGVERYLECFGETRGEALIESEDNNVESLEFIDPAGQVVTDVEHGGDLRIRLTFCLTRDVMHPNVTILVHNREMQTVAVCRNPPRGIVNETGRITTEVVVNHMILNPADYRISVTVHDEDNRHHLIWYSGMWTFRVVGHIKDYGASIVSFPGHWTTP